MEEPMNIIVLGAGLVGGAIARDLAGDPDLQVAAVDLDVALLTSLTASSPIDSIQIDLQEDGAIESVVADCDLVVSAVPGFMGFESLRRIISAGKDVVDISFFGEDPFELDDLAKKNDVTAVVDCGVAPGLSNIIAGRVHKILDRTDRYVCYVGGLPAKREWPFEYKAVFSPIDVLAEYTRPARFVENGETVVKPALSDIELLDLPGVGQLEAFNTDGLHTLARTLDAPFMIEKTLRYPGHAELMRIFRESGFFSEEAVDVNGRLIRPIELTSKLLFDMWRLERGEEDLTVMQVILDGEENGKNVRYSYYLLDRYDTETGTTSMARTTGYTCSIVARMVSRGLFSRKGICPPEYIGLDEGCYEFLLQEYEKRSIGLKETISSC
jgi:lysine 6-dehydrogenase